MVRDETELVDTTAPAVATTDQATRSVAPAPVLETAVPDVRDTATRDATEDDPALRHQVPTADETAAAVARAQQALAEIDARREADAAREAQDAEQTARSEELTRWAEQDQAAEAAPETTRDDDTVLQR